MGIKIPFKLRATKCNFVKRIDFSYNDGTINSSLPEVASLTFTYIETIGFAEVASLITSSSCKTRGEVHVSIHHENPKVQGSSTEIFAREIISGDVSIDARDIFRIAIDINVHRYRHRHSVEPRPGRTHLDTRIDSGFHVSAVVMSSLCNVIPDASRFT